MDLGEREICGGGTGRNAGKRNCSRDILCERRIKRNNTLATKGVGSFQAFALSIRKDREGTNEGNLASWSSRGN